MQLKSFCFWLGTAWAIAATGACQPSVPSARHGYLKLDDHSLRGKLHLSQTGDTDLEEMAAAAMRSLTNTMKLPNVKLSISDGNEIFSHPEIGVVIGREKLREIFDQSDVSQFQKIIIFILAHEMGHQLQYRRYGADHVLDSSDSELRVYECQADILGGYYLLEAFSHFRWGESTLDPQEIQDIGAQEDQALSDTLRVSFDLGEETDSLGDHPSKTVRRGAVQLGMANGMAKRWEEMPPVPAALRATLLPPEAQATVLKERINVEAGEDPMRWSLRQARRLCHENQDLLAKIKLTSSETNIVPVFIQGLGTMPVYSFELTYQNIGDRPVKLDLEVGTYFVDKDDHDDLNKRLKGDAYNTKFTLYPGRSRTITKEVPAFLPGYNFPDLEPILIFFPAANSLISATAVTPVGGSN